MSDEDLIEARGICATYGDVIGLYDFNFRFKPGDAVLFFGRNGAGKSSALRVLSGAIRLFRGRIVKGSLHLDGVDATTLDSHEFPRRGICLVPETGGLVRTMTVRENLRLTTHVTGLSDAEYSLQFDQIVGELPLLQERLDRRGETLSGGERRVASLARACLLNPRVLLLDEPTKGLDRESLPAIVRLLGARRARGLSLIVVEHRLGSWKAEMWTRALEFEGGRVLREIQMGGLDSPVRQ